MVDKVQSLLEKRKKVISLLDDMEKSMFLEMFGDPIVNRKQWAKVRLAALGDWHSGGTPLRSNTASFEGNIPWITSGELNNVFIEDSKEKITAAALANSSAKPMKINSLLIGMYDTAALKMSITKVEGCCNQAIAFAQIDEKKCNTLFLYYALLISKEYYLSQRQGVRQQNLSLNFIRNIEIIQPTLRLQDEFEKKILKILAIKEQYQKIIHSNKILYDALIYFFVQNPNSLEERPVDKLLKDKYERAKLMDKLATQDFATLEEYDEARKLFFELLKTGESHKIIQQVYKEKTKSIDLQEVTNS